MLRKGNFHRLAFSSVDQDVVEKPNGPSLSFSMNKLKSVVLAQTRQKTGEGEARSFRAKIAPESNSSAEKELTKNISKDMFKGMEVLDQFNLGFIIPKLDNDLFIIDQHASDEKLTLRINRGTQQLNPNVLLFLRNLKRPLSLWTTWKYFKRTDFILRLITMPRQ
ncbi:unnamed protein product [Porites lobata]|uniref:MutL C-terminal dimerisation domain-containing protein n=1 Tax=Porites lobata TaxID=104759 RepID=A0ABN8SAM3_9CNID|nr:unnamed protein product [Porites lobata]